MTYAFTRTEARILPEYKGKTNVVTELVVGMTGTDEDSGLSVYRDTLVSLPDPDDDFTPFEEIDAEWIAPICAATAEDKDWEASMVSEIEAAKSRPISKLFKFQEPEAAE